VSLEDRLKKIEKEFSSRNSVGSSASNYRLVVLLVDDHISTILSTRQPQTIKTTPTLISYKILILHTGFVYDRFKSKFSPLAPKSDFLVRW
jgi:hypothetical protein